MLPWARFRKTYAAAIETRELVRRRCGRMAAMIVACNALVDWCSWQLDAGFRGEMECIIAKIFGSECQKEAAIELFMKTHGGRAFLHGHLFGDNVHEFLAPCIYEGEGEMLGMAFLKSLIKEHGTKYYEPIGKAMAAAGIKNPNAVTPGTLWAIRGALWPYASWRLKQLLGAASKPVIPSDGPNKLREHAEWAAGQLQKSRMAVDGLMQKFKLGLADRQCSMAELSARIQDQVVILVTALWAATQRRVDPRRRRRPLSRPPPQTDRSTAKQFVLQDRHKAWRSDRRRRLLSHRRHRRERDPDAVWMKFASLTTSSLEFAHFFFHPSHHPISSGRKTRLPIRPPSIAKLTSSPK